MKPPYIPSHTTQAKKTPTLTDKTQFHPHYDGRFAAAILPYADSKHHLSILLQTYLSTMHDLGVETWIMHGSLLGWWWNRKVMPWDSDVDVQVSEASLDFLASYHNMTVHRFPIVPDLRAETGDDDGDGGVDEKNEKKKEKEKGRSYLLEINPHYRNGSVTDTLNVIDARWIDMTTGLFIDITGLRRDREAEQAGRPGQMMCKDRHQYMYDDIFPLRDSVFEGVPARVPFKYIELLEQEYGKTALTRTEYEGHVFEQQTMEWKPRSG